MLGKRALVHIMKTPHMPKFMRTHPLSHTRPHTRARTEKRARAQTHAHTHIGACPRTLYHLVLSHSKRTHIVAFSHPIAHPCTRPFTQTPCTDLLCAQALAFHLHEVQASLADVSLGCAGRQTQLLPQHLVLYLRRVLEEAGSASVVKHTGFNMRWSMVAKHTDCNTC